MSEVLPAGAAASTTCPLTGRLGVHTRQREHRPRTTVARTLLRSDPVSCPFCGPAADDPRLLGEEVDLGAGRWFGLRNIFPPLDGPTGSAELAVATAHGPTLTHDQPLAATVWATQLLLQQRLALRRGERWSLLTTAVGVSAGASQHHPHGQVLSPVCVPPMTVATQHCWQRPEVTRMMLAEDRTVAVRGGLHLVAPPVPLGPLDLLIVPPDPVALHELDMGELAALIVVWLTAVRQQLGVVGADPAGPAPLDVKTLLHAELPDGTGRCWMELQVTQAHAPGVAAAPIVDMVDLPASHAARFRRTDPSA